MPDLHQGVPLGLEAESMRGEVMRVLTQEDEQFRQFEGEKGVVEILESLIREQIANRIEVCQLSEMLLNVGTAFFQAYVAQVLQK